MRLEDYFRNAIKNADWTKVCKVFTQITGKPIDPPVVKPSVLDIEVEDDEGNANDDSPANIEMKDEDDGEATDEEESSSTQPVRSVITDDFRVQHGNGVKERVSGRQAMSVPLGIPTKRVNKFKDDQTAHANELVTVNPKLGVANPRPRGNRELIEGAVDTGVFVNVTCSLCGKQEKVSSSLAIGHSTRKDDNTYKCNDCSTSSGRTKLHRKLMNEIR